MPTGVWLPAFEKQGGVDFMRCPSTCSTVEAPGALKAPAPAAKRDGCHGGAHFAYPTALDSRAAIEQLTKGAIAASVAVGAKPMPLISGIPANQGLHLLPVAFGGGLEAIYLPTGFDHDDYPNLIEMETEIPSVATGMVLLAAASKDDPGHADRVAQLVDTLFSRFGELKKDGRHPKWREINLAASLPGWTRTPAAEAWLTQHPNEDARKVAQAKIEAGAVQSNLPVGQNQRDVLFKQYIEWQRAKGH